MEIKTYKNTENFLECCEEPVKYNLGNESRVDDYINETDPLGKYIKYKASHTDLLDSGYEKGKEFTRRLLEDNGYEKLHDCDGSSDETTEGLILDIYEKLWGWTKTYNNFGKVKCLKFKCYFGADTLNSMQHTLNDIVRELIKKEEYKLLSAKKSKRAATSIRYVVELYADGNTRELFKKAIYSVENLKENLRLHNTIGGFGLVPSGFNAFRGCNGTIRDYMDLSLMYLLEKGWGSRFNPGGSGIADYYRYINYFFLWDYVDKLGRPIVLLNRANNEIKNKEEYLRKIARIVDRRGKFMVAMLRLHKEIGESSYREIREGILAKDDRVYSGYGEAIESIRGHLGDRLTHETKGMLDNTIARIGEA